mmetsp:Transcript_127962/g.246549  ORF Transcript_127962/g.246549 Transcript_127962/m.246549 type:complete len:316 (+) Transcript_127962:95-1042(+)
MEDIPAEIRKAGSPPAAGPPGHMANGVNAVRDGPVRDATAILTASRDARRRNRTMKGAAWDRLERKVTGELELDWGNLLGMVDPSRERDIRDPPGHPPAVARERSPGGVAREKSPPAAAREKSPAVAAREGARERSPAPGARTPPRSQTPPAPLRPPPRAGGERGDRGGPRGPGSNPGISSPGPRSRPITKSRQTLLSIQQAAKESMPEHLPQPSRQDARPAVVRSPPAPAAQASAGTAGRTRPAPVPEGALPVASVEAPNGEARAREGSKTEDSENVEVLERRFDTYFPPGAPTAFAPAAAAAATSAAASAAAA